MQVLILFICIESLRPSHFFSIYFGMGVPRLNQYFARINVSCSRTQRSDTSEARTLNLSVSSQAHTVFEIGWISKWVNDGLG